MLTLRHEWDRDGQKEHSLHECREYQKQVVGGRTVITMDQGTAEPRQLIIDGSDQAVYAMNADGKTIDVIRPAKETTSK